MVQIHIYAIIMIKFSHWKSLKKKKIYNFSILPVFHVKLELNFAELLSISHSFPMAGQFWAKSTSVTPQPARIKPSIFVCVHIQNAITVTKFHTI